MKSAQSNFRGRAGRHVRATRISFIKHPCPGSRAHPQNDPHDQADRFGHRSTMMYVTYRPRTLHDRFGDTL